MARPPYPYTDFAHEIMDNYEFEEDIINAINAVADTTEHMPDLKLKAIRFLSHLQQSFWHYMKDKK
ncbi:MAG: hypothetical protein AAF388_05475 [Bacteroidota bacterium]